MARQCADCPADISQRHGTAQRCKVCARARKAFLVCQSRRARRTPPACLDCGVDLSQGVWRFQRCRECNAKRRRAQYRAFWHRKTPEQKRLAQRKYKGLRKYIKALVSRDGCVCQICRRRLPKDKRGWHVDHVVPRSMGGSDALHNLRLAHAYCNIARQNCMSHGEQYALDL